MMPAVPFQGNDQPLGVLRILAYFYLQNNLPAKAAILLAALEHIGHMTARSYAMLALAHLRNGNVKLALATLERMAAAGHSGRAYHLIHAQTLVAANRQEEARQSMQRYLALRTPAPAVGDLAQTIR